GKRNLAYKIKHLTEGFYATIYFRSIPDVVKELDRVLKIDDNIIRHIIVRHDERQQKKLQENIEKAKESSTEEVKKSNDEEIKESE
ncbi:30S ribosomal protein S6, partial [Peptococcaceae bacterium]|nr:30S ribosomal protein S6 [Peptococcaceae bacterium]